MISVAHWRTGITQERATLSVRDHGAGAALHHTHLSPSFTIFRHQLFKGGRPAPSASAIRLLDLREFESIALLSRNDDTRTNC